MDKNLEVNTENGKKMVQIEEVVLRDLVKANHYHEMKAVNELIEGEKVVHMQKEAEYTSKFITFETNKNTGKKIVIYDHVRQAIEIIQELKIMYNKFGMFYYNENSGLWSANARQKIKKTINYKLGTYATTTRVNETLQAIDRCYDENVIALPFDTNVNLTGFLNGVYNWKTREFREYRPTDYLTSCIPHNYNPEAKSPLIERYFTSMLDDKKQFFLEWIGYTFYRSYCFQRFLIVYGKGNNGKSTLLEVYAKIVGKSNVSSLPLIELGDRSFLRAELLGKYANICSDIGDDYFKSSASLKELTGNDIITANRKGIPPIQFINIAKMTFSANALPTFKDKTVGMNRRITILPLTKEITETNVDFLPIITTEAEIEGIIITAIEAFHKVLDSKEFSITDEMEQARLEWIIKMDHVRSFVEEECVLNPNKSIEKSTLHYKFEMYCQRNHYVSIGANQFYQRLLETYPSLQNNYRHRNEVNNKKEYHFKGIGLED